MSIPKKRSGLGPRPKPIATPGRAEATGAPSVADSFVAPTYTMLTVRINKDVHLSFKSAVAAQGEKMRDIVEELLEEWTRENPP